MIYETKAQLRKAVKKEISLLPDDYLAASDEGIYHQVTSLKEFVDAGNIMIYYSVEREPTTYKIAHAAIEMGKTVAFPLCYREGIMEARVVSSFDDFKPSIIGIPSPPETAPKIAPQELDLILVPALAYDFYGYRLGLGGGYFDRYLQGLEVFTAGLARECLIRDSLPCEPHDIPVNCIVTEERVLRF